jgi:hypothetical protein
MRSLVYIGFLMGIQNFALGSDQWDIRNHDLGGFTESVSEEGFKPRAPDRSIRRAPAGASSSTVLSIFPSGAPRQISILATKSGFVPDTITISNTDTVTLHLTTTEDESCFVSTQLGIRRGLRTRTIQSVEIPANLEPGIYNFSCGIQEIKGSIVVRD